jgi:hypothetical protein
MIPVELWRGCGSCGKDEIADDLVRFEKCRVAAGFAGDCEVGEGEGEGPIGLAPEMLRLGMNHRVAIPSRGCRV